jgi:hypothetical protein
VKEKKLSRKLFRCREREKRRLTVLDAVALCRKKNKNKKNKQRAVRFVDLLTICVLLLGTNYRKRGGGRGEKRREEGYDRRGSRAGAVVATVRWHLQLALLQP